MKRELTFAQQVERSITKKYRKEIWNPFVAAVKRYELIKEGDKIAVCISGGKDSMLLAKLMQMLQRYSEVPFEQIFLVMNPGYNEENLLQIQKNAELLELPVEIFNTDIFEILFFDFVPRHFSAELHPSVFGREPLRERSVKAFQCHL